MTMTTEQHVRSLVKSAESRLDFQAAIQELRDAIEVTERDGSMLLARKDAAIRAAMAAIRILESRYVSAVDLEEALLSVDQAVDTLEEPVAQLFMEWFFHVIYNGRDINHDARAIASRLVARLQGDIKENSKKLLRDLGNYAWFANYGPNPALTLNNAIGLRRAAAVLPLAPNVATDLQRRAEEVVHIAERRRQESQVTLVRGCLEHYAKLLAAAKVAHNADSSSYLGQTDSYGVRASLTNIEAIISVNEEFGEIEEELLETVTRLRDEINVVGYRSSSAIFAAYEREAELLQAEVSVVLSSVSSSRKSSSWRTAFNLTPERSGRDR